MHTGNTRRRAPLINLDAPTNGWPRDSGTRIAPSLPIVILEADDGPRKRKHSVYACLRGKVPGDSPDDLWVEES